LFTGPTEEKVDKNVATVGKRRKKRGRKVLGKRKQKHNGKTIHLHITLPVELAEELDRLASIGYRKSYLIRNALEKFLEEEMNIL